MNGWRYWRIDRHRLRSPLAGDPLPGDATLRAACHRPHTPPWPGCTCGVSYYPNRTDVLTAFHSIGLDPAQFVITAGVVASPTLADTAAQLYRAGWRTVAGPDALRCHAYTVTEIYTDTAATFDYNVPVHNLPTL